MSERAASGEVLSDAMLASFAERCGGFDRENLP